MKKICKQLYYWFAQLLKSVVSLLSALFFSSRRTIKGIRQIGNNKTGACIILGNGPSLKKSLSTSIEDIKNYDNVAVNLFCQSEFFPIITPRYYVLTDPAFFNDRIQDERVINEQNKLKDGFKNVTWEMTLFLPSINRTSQLVRNITNSKIKVVFYNLTPIDGFLSVQHWLFKKNLGMPRAMNVMCASIFLMINLGYREIYLLGADHSWLESFYVNERNQVILGDKHFYGDQSVVCPYSLSKWLQNVSTGFRTHERLSEYANYMGVKVYNATEGSYIDAYERKKIIG